MLQDYNFFILLDATPNLRRAVAVVVDATVNRACGRTVHGMMRHGETLQAQ